ncbi:MAG TPA: hypothetical protein DEG17_21590 [Cyanobacteria bacterium UBA11149]|nr:hypothetical protein [Cyanobacteria bacterium UBA11367]HBE60723.1 hypothetical protein [Cyanobacteria bacterium UBA11366]HBK65454.1 hypothetical protein [Cyanobacteria bacterium UBA11166]HBR74480.1 hypothetical protein [Cyanobacteria bacterium UBA11159]HBS68278.1 hypothetical protein [Cyanobacteria bacterium UBA11153]HBW91381.1 hypothetical protein [Cyanobacteria bacterium UBA11149]HCA93584.1 hypothetical protein [Cyanobacteria bacterium UBA9226]
MNYEESLQIAQNPHTSPEVLRKLANCFDRMTRRNVAANPNIPTDILWELGQQFPQEILNNPIFSLLLLEKPNLVEEIPPSTLKSILKEDDVPISFLNWALNQRDREMRFAIVMNRQTPQKILDKLIHSDDSLDREILLTIAINPKTPKEILAKLLQSNDRLDREIALAITMNPETPKEILVQLLHSNNMEIVEAGKLHVNLAGEMNQGWDRVAKDKIIEIAAIDKEVEQYLSQLDWFGLIPDFVTPYLAKYETILPILSMANSYYQPPEIFMSEYLISCEDRSPLDVFKQLASHPDSVSLIAIAQEYLSRYPHRLPRVFEKLTEKSQSFSIRIFALLHHRITAKALTDNSRSIIWLERYAIAQHHNTPIDILYTLAKDGNQIVRAAAKANLQTLSEFNLL